VTGEVFTGAVRVAEAHEKLNSAGLQAGWSGVRVPIGARNFSHHRVQMGPTQPPIQWVPGALSLGLKRPGREVNHAPPSSAEVKNPWSYVIYSHNTPSWRGAQLKHRDNFTLYRSNTTIISRRNIIQWPQMEEQEMQSGHKYWKKEGKKLVPVKFHHVIDV
jgi:hypothetical protein